MHQALYTFNSVSARSAASLQDVTKFWHEANRKYGYPCRLDVVDDSDVSFCLFHPRARFSTSLPNRIALWERKKYIMIPLIFLSLAHWGILWRGMFIIDAAWDPVAERCVVMRLDAKFLQTTFFSSKYSGERATKVRY